METVRQRLDGWIPIVGATSLLFATLIDARIRYMWVDELLTATLAADRSFGHMIHALADQVDTSPPLFYAIAWLWARVFGVNALSLRGLAGLFGAASFVLVWRLMRPYGMLAARGVAVCAAVLLPGVVLAQFAEARAYGLLMALAALSLVQLDAVATKPPTRRLLAGIALTQAALCLAHVYGLAYSVATFVALVASDRIARRRGRAGLYTAWMCGWLAFAGWWPDLRSQMQVGVPSFPIARPGVGALLGALLLGTSVRSVIFLVLAIVFALALARRAVPDAAMPEPKAPVPRHLVFAAVAWIGVALAAWAWSRAATPIFLPRYLVPLSLAYAVLLTVALDTGLRRANRAAARDPAEHASRPPARSYVWMLAPVAAIALYAPAAREAGKRFSLHPDGDSLDLRSDVPIATISTHTYLPRAFYSVRPQQYVFVLDWQSALRPDAPVGPTEYHLMQAMRRNYPEHRIESSDEFLGTHSRFYVIDEGGLFWFKDRIAHNPAYEVQLISSQHMCGTGQPNETCPLYLVERRGDR